MKNENEKFSLINVINIITSRAMILTEKLGKLISNKNSHDSIEMILKIVITIILIALIKIPFSLLEELGRYYIYEVGTVFRQYLSIFWTLTLNYVYLVFGILVLYKVLSNTFYDKELNIYEKDRKKDKKIKKDIFIPLIKVLRTILLIILIPFIIMIAFLFIMLGMNFALLLNGVCLVSLFFIIIGLIIINFSVILIITKLIFEKGGNK